MRSREILLTVAMAAAAVLAVGAEPRPTSAKARDGIAKYEKAMLETNGRYQQEAARAGKQLLEDLAAAEKNALREQDLDEANRIRAYSERAKLQAVDAGGDVGRVLAGSRWAAGTFGTLEFGPNNTWRTSGTFGRFEVIAPLRLRGRIRTAKEEAEWSVTLDPGMDHLLIVSDTGLFAAAKRMGAE